MARPRKNPVAQAPEPLMFDIRNPPLDTKIMLAGLDPRGFQMEIDGIDLSLKVARALGPALGEVQREVYLHLRAMIDVAGRPLTKATAAMSLFVLLREAQPQTEDDHEAVRTAAAACRKACLNAWTMHARQNSWMTGRELMTEMAAAGHRPPRSRDDELNPHYEPTEEELQEGLKL